MNIESRRPQKQLVLLSLDCSINHKRTEYNHWLYKIYYEINFPIYLFIYLLFIYLCLLNWF